MEISLVAIVYSSIKSCILVAEMGEAYPELRDNEDRIVAALKQEEGSLQRRLTLA